VGFGYRPCVEAGADIYVEVDPECVVFLHDRHGGPQPVLPRPRRTPFGTYSLWWEEKVLFLFASRGHILGRLELLGCDLRLEKSRRHSHHPHLVRSVSLRFDGDLKLWEKTRELVLAWAKAHSERPGEIRVKERVWASGQWSDVDVAIPDDPQTILSGVKPAPVGPPEDLNCSSA